MNERITTYRAFVRAAYEDLDGVTKVNLVDVEYSTEGPFLVITGYPKRSKTGNAQNHVVHLAQLLKLELGPVITDSSWQQTDTAASAHLHRVELDTVDPHDHDLVTYASEHEITMSVLAEVGPGGGHPLVEYTGAYSALVNLILTHFDDGTGEDNELLTEITTVA